jgi:hypothetical protein
MALRPLPALVRPWPYVLGGLLSGFLLLTELALITVPLVQGALLALAVAGLVGVVRRSRSLELWPLFVATAMPIPLTVDARVAALPRCDAAAFGVACFAGARDVAAQLAVDQLILASALVGVGALVAREVRRLRPGATRMTG